MPLAIVTGSSGGIGQSVCKVLAVRASMRVGTSRRGSVLRARLRPLRLSAAFLAPFAPAG